MSILLRVSRLVLDGTRGPLLWDLDTSSLQRLLLLLSRRSHRDDGLSGRRLGLDLGGLDRGGLGTDETEESEEHTDERESSGGQTSSDFGHGLDGMRDVKASEVWRVSVAPQRRSSSTHG